MEPFQRSHPNYSTYRSEHFHVSEVTRDLVDGFHGLIAKHCPGTDSLKSAVNIIQGHLPEPPSNNWSYDWIASDLGNSLGKLSKKPFHKFVDCMGALRDELQRTDFPTDLDELLEEQAFGYIAERAGARWHWKLRDDATEVGVAVIEEAQAEVAGICEQALSHLEQAKENLKRGDERSRKDAVRDAMSAMESLYKSLSGEADIADAYKKMRADGTWGPDDIVKEGLSIWNRLHHLYPDVRHGQASATSLSEDEAQYWIGRMTLIVKYLSRKHE